MLCNKIGNETGNENNCNYDNIKYCFLAAAMQNIPQWKKFNKLINNICILEFNEQKGN